MKKIRFTPFEIAYIVLGLLVNTVISLLTKASPVSTFYAYSCVLGGILLTKARLEGYFLQVAMGILYLFLAWQQKYYGEVINSLLTIPITLYGMYNWFTRRNSTENTVNIVKASKKEAAIIIVSQLLLIPLYYFLLSRYEGSMLWVQSLSLAISIMAFYFSARISVLSYYCFLSKDILSTILWIVPLINGDASAWLVIVPNILFFINDLYGLYSWNRMLEKQKTG